MGVQAVGHIDMRENKRGRGGVGYCQKRLEMKRQNDNPTEGRADRQTDR